MDAGSCVTCHTLLGEVDLEGVLGLFPRVRCPSCGLVNVLASSTVAAYASGAHGLDDAPLSPRGRMETSIAIGIPDPVYDDPESAMEAEPSEFDIPPVSDDLAGDISFGEEAAPVGDDFSNDVSFAEEAFSAEEGAESTRIGIDLGVPSDEDEN